MIAGGKDACFCPLFFFYMNLRITIFCLLIAQSAFLQDSNDVKRAYISEVISFLASDSLRGREAGSVEEEIASTFIVEKFKALQSCKVKRQKFQFKRDGITYKSQNVLAFLNNKSDFSQYDIFKGIRRDLNGGELG